ncbi:Translation initiation factor IF-2 [Frankliniella fusca]|uniref:Gustatory receptor n=1 Tax=Frankliniella fusca TaxID=407009 RepID=A0AAE1H396_9NEOP|nr:Translation initiation factor IF-2 [Frankliniella fusca]
MAARGGAWRGVAGSGGAWRPDEVSSMRGGAESWDMIHRRIKETQETQDEAQQQAPGPGPGPRPGSKPGPGPFSGGPGPGPEPGPGPRPGPEPGPESGPGRRPHRPPRGSLHALRDVQATAFFRSSLVYMTVVRHTLWALVYLTTVHRRDRLARALTKMLRARGEYARQRAMRPGGDLQGHHDRFARYFLWLAATYLAASWMSFTYLRPPKEVRRPVQMLAMMVEANLELPMRAALGVLVNIQVRDVTARLAAFGTDVHLAARENWKKDLWRQLRRRHMDIYEAQRAAAHATFFQVAVAVFAVTLECICESYNTFNFVARHASAAVNPLWPVLATLELSITLIACHGAQREVSSATSAPSGSQCSSVPHVGSV